MKKTTESESFYQSLEKMSTSDLLTNMNNEDKSVPLAIEKELKAIETFIEASFERMKAGGRLFWCSSRNSNWNNCRW